MDAGLLVLSAAVLMLEVLQTRIFAFSLDPVTIYLAISMCLLGLGAAATVLALGPPLPPARARIVAAAATVVGAVAAFGAHVFFARHAGDLLTGGVGALPVLVLLTAPYFCFGVATTLLFAARGHALGRVYAVNLAGSAIGCLLVLPLVDRIGAEGTVVAVSGLAAAGALVLAPLRLPAAVASGLAVSIALAFAARLAPEVLAFPPDPTGQMVRVQRRAAVLARQHGAAAVTDTPVFARWDRTARVDILRLDSQVPALQSRIGGPLETLFFAQDASAGSMLIGVGDDLGRGREFFERTVYGLAYALRSGGDVLVIGLGGAPDVQTALYHKARHVDAVEINRTTIDVVGREFRDFVGDPYGRPEVAVHQLDGRTFLRQADGRYDVIQLSGVDTKAVHAAGSLSVNQHHVYTREAMRELLSHLRPDGVLAIIIFSNHSVSRLTATAVAALGDLGAAVPREHLFVVEQGMFFGMLAKRSPFLPAEVAALHAWAARAGAEGPEVFIPTYDWVGITFRRPINVLYSPAPEPRAVGPFFTALTEDRLAAFLAEIAAVGIDLSPPLDDRPFFFFIQTPMEALRGPPLVLQTIARLLGWLVLISSVLILLPLLVRRGRGLGAPRAVRALAYFACLGAGFMLVEIGLIQHFVLLLGHQSYAITVVLTGLLLGAGAGSFVSGTVPASWRAPLVRVLGAIVLVVLVYAFALTAVFDVAARAPFALRLALALVLLVGLGFLLGMPFPVGLRAVRAVSPSFVAWGIGVNGFASVVGSTLAVPLAMLVGLRMLLLLGALLYALAIVAAPLGRGDPARAA
jgi:SAM-dependent methyltransferase